MKLPAKIRLSLSNVILLFLIASPAILWVLDRTLVFEDRLLRDRYLAPYRVLSSTLIRMKMDIRIVLTDHETEFKSVMKLHANNIDFFIENYRSLMNDIIRKSKVEFYGIPQSFCGMDDELLVPSMISCYIFG